MNKSESIKELASALSKAQGEFEHAKKDVNNPFYKSKYADLANCIDAAKAPLSMNGLSVVQVLDINDSLGVVLETMLMHTSGEWISGKYPISPLKNDPQAFGSCIQYARRYAFSAMTGIAADDDDGNAASQPSTKQHPIQHPVVDYKSAIDSAKNINELRALFPTFPQHLKKELTEIATSKSKTFAQQKEAA